MRIILFFVLFQSYFETLSTVLNSVMGADYPNEVDGLSVSLNFPSNSAFLSFPPSSPYFAMGSPTETKKNCKNEKVFAEVIYNMEAFN